MAANDQRAMVPSRERVDELGVRESTAIAETASTAVATQVRAIVEARYVMALRRPRDLERVAARILADCDVPEFAEQAIYKKPVGGEKIEGLSIRFAESAIQAMTNVAPEERVIYDDADKRIISVSLTDLETNVPYSRDVTISKTVERSSNRGRIVLGERKNSDGRTVYIVVATDDELANKEAALCSKVRRNHALALLPPAIKSAAIARCKATSRAAAAKEKIGPRVERVVAFFAEHGVTQVMLAAYLRHPLLESTPEELDDLRAIGIALRDGETTWSAVMEEREAGTAGDGQPKAPPRPGPASPPRRADGPSPSALAKLEEEERRERAAKATRDLKPAKSADDALLDQVFGGGDPRPIQETPVKQGDPPPRDAAEPKSSPAAEPRPNSPEDLGFREPPAPPASAPAPGPPPDDEVDEIFGELSVLVHGVPSFESVAAFDQRIAQLDHTHTRHVIPGYFAALCRVMEVGPRADVDRAMKRIGGLKAGKHLSQHEVDDAKAINAKRLASGE